MRIMTSSAHVWLSFPCQEATFLVDFEVAQDSHSVTSTIDVTDEVGTTSFVFVANTICSGDDFLVPVGTPDDEIARLMTTSAWGRREPEVPSC